MSFLQEVVRINDDLYDLKCQRGNKKAGVTRAKTYIQGITTTIDKLDVSELQCRLDNFLLTIKHF